MHANAHDIVVREIATTGPISTADVIHRLSGELPRIAVLRAVSEATDSGELTMDLLGRTAVSEPADAR